MPGHENGFFVDTLGLEFPIPKARQYLIASLDIVRESPRLPCRHRVGRQPGAKVDTLGLEFPNDALCIKGSIDRTVLSYFPFPLPLAIWRPRYIQGRCCRSVSLIPKARQYLIASLDIVIRRKHSKSLCSSISYCIHLCSEMAMLASIALVTILETKIHSREVLQVGIVDSKGAAVLDCLTRYSEGPLQVAAKN
jgi:hypothetical protein